MNKNNRLAFASGMKDGIPIALGYFAVAFTLGIIAKKAGITALQSAIFSATCISSTGEYVGFTLIGEKAAYIEIAIMTLVANARYLLLSCALSQKLSPKMSFIHRLFMGIFVTDEIFGINIACKEELNPFYTYGAAAISVPAWALGTMLGVLMGEILPNNIVSALSVGIYGMFIAIIVPPSKENKVVAALVVISMLVSYIATRFPVFAVVSSGTRTIIITVLISAVAAICFPRTEEQEVAA